MKEEEMEFKVGDIVEFVSEKDRALVDHHVRTMTGSGLPEGPYVVHRVDRDNGCIVIRIMGGASIMSDDPMYFASRFVKVEPEGFQEGDLVVLTEKAQKSYGQSQGIEPGEHIRATRVHAQRGACNLCHLNGKPINGDWVYERLRLVGKHEEKAPEAPKPETKPQPQPTAMAVHLTREKDIAACQRAMDDAARLRRELDRPITKPKYPQILLAADLWGNSWRR